MAMVRLGRRISVRDIYRIVGGTKVGFRKGIFERLNRNYKAVMKIAVSDEAVYGVNTGFGSLAKVRIKPNRIQDLQRNLIMSHCAGVGQPLSATVVRAAMAIRINTLIKGHSGVRSKVVRLLADMLNRGVHPIVPSQGSVGASGDLAPTAAVASVMIGKGKAEYEGKIYNGSEALRIAGLKPIAFGAKEGLAVLNGTQFMSALASVGMVRFDNLLKHADLAGAISIEALRGTNKCFDSDLIGLRPHQGIILVARNLRRILKGSKIIKSHLHCNKVQDPYSLRCIPQVHGSVREGYIFAKDLIELEINSVTDNPVFIPRKNTFISGGNFHGQPLAMAMDLLVIGISYLSSISERRTARLLDHSVSGLPAHLAQNPGLNSGLMILQLTTAALTAENRNLANPSSIFSIPTSANQEDLVSMGMNSGLKFLRVLDNLKRILAIEIICALQGLEFLRPLRSSPTIEHIHRKVRRVIPYLKRDRELTPFVDELCKLIDDHRLTKGIKID